MANLTKTSEVELTAAKNGKVIEFGPNNVKAALAEQAPIKPADMGDRVPAPPVRFAPGVDERKALVDQLDKSDPAFVHSYQKRDVDEWELTSKSQTLVRDEEGRVMHHLGDPVVKQPKELWDAARTEEGRRAQEVIETRLEKSQATQTRQPKKPTAVTGPGVINK